MNISEPTAYTTDDGHDVTGVHYGVAVVSFEGGDVALTHDPRRAVAAFGACYRHLTGESLLQWAVGGDLDLERGWLRFETRADGEWVVSADAGETGAREATWLTW